MSAPMISFDCGRFCVKANRGGPLCCDQKKFIPLLFKAEYRLLKERGQLWTRMPVITKAEKKLVEDICDYNVFCLCQGVKSCRRSLRSLSCRAFPFEPFVNADGKVIGIVFQYEKKEKCPLIGMPESVFNPRYIRNSIIFWQEIIDIIPEEKDLFIDESRKRIRRAKRNGGRIVIFGNPSARSKKRGLSLEKLSRARSLALAENSDGF